MNREHMYNDRPSTPHIVLTLVGLVVGLLLVFGAIFAIANAMAPKPVPVAAPAETSPSVSATPAAAVPEVAPTPVVAAPAPSTPVYTPPKATSPAPRRSPAVSKPLSGKVVVIDAGHQAHGDSSLEPIGPGASAKKPKVTTGASGVQTRNAESLINLQVALKLRNELESRGARVVMIRTSQNVNISNSARAAVANREHADLFIRLHCDGNNNHSMVGLSTLVPQSNKWTKPIVVSSRRAATYVHKAVIAQTGAKNRGVIDRGDLSGFNWAKVPTVLVEMGFLSNRGEDVKLGTPSYQTTLARGLANGVADYLQSN